MITDLSKDYTQANITSDFSIKMMEGTIKGYQDYYELANKRGVEFSSKVAANRSILRAIEESENAKKIQAATFSQLQNKFDEELHAEHRVWCSW